MRRTKTLGALTAAREREREDEQAAEDAGCITNARRWFYARVFTDLREDDDTFDLILRKIVVSVGLLLSIFPTSFALYLAAEVATSGATAGAITTLVVMLLFPAIWILTFVYVRSERVLPDALMDGWLIATTLGVLLLALSFVEYPIGQLAVFLGVLALLCQSQRLIVHVVLSLLVYGVAMLNSAFSGLSPHPEVSLLTIPDPYRGTILERVAYQVTCMAIGLIVGAALMMQTKERQRHETAALSAIEMSRVVAEQLSIYDIDAVKATLNMYTAEGIADPDLVQHLGLIADNLETYRPHLPNWMLNELHQHDDGDADGDGSGDNSCENDPSAGGELTAHDKDFGSTVNSADGHNGTATSSSDGGPHATNGQFRMGVAYARSRRTSLMVPPPGATNSPMSIPGKTTSPGTKAVLSPGKAFLLGHPHHGSPHAPRSYWAGRITMAAVDFKITQKVTARQREDLMGRFVDRVHAVAKQTKAAVHTFIGDQVFVSWNTTAKVAQPEAQASRFLVRVSEIATDHPQFRLSGAAFSGDARCVMAGVKHTALTIAFRWREALRALTTYCHRHGAFAVDGSTRQNCQYDVVTRGVDALLVNDWRVGSTSPTSPASATRVVTVFELVREVSDDECNDEWMYVLRRSAGDETGDRVVQLCLEGQFVPALEKLEIEMEQTVNDLRSRVGSSAQLPTVPVSTVPGAIGLASSPSAGNVSTGPAPDASAGSGSEDIESPQAGSMAMRPRPMSSSSRSRDVRPMSSSSRHGRPTAARSPSSSLNGRGALFDCRSPTRWRGGANLDVSDDGEGSCGGAGEGIGSFATTASSANAMRLMHHLHEKIQRFIRENLPASRFPEDFTMANWKM